MAYILGFFAADGYITVNKRGGQYWCIQITDKKLLYAIRTAVKSNHTIGVRKRKKNESILYRLQIGSTKMCNDLRTLGFAERKTKTLLIPNIPDQFFPHFVRGYFDGDGNIWSGLVHKNRKKPVIILLSAFTSCSYSFLSHLRSKLFKYGIQGGCIYKAKKGFSRLQYATYDSLKIYEIMYNTNAVNALYLQRKRKVFDNFLKMRV